MKLVEKKGSYHNPTRQRGILGKQPNSQNSIPHLRFGFRKLKTRNFHNGRVGFSKRLNQ